MNHRSIRNYDAQKDVSDADLATIIQAGQMAPNSINGQQVSVIAVRDQQRREYLAELTGEQVWIAQAPVFLVFLMDFYRASLAAKKWGRNFDFVKSSTAVITGSLDVGLFVQNVINAAESLGLGTVPIGGVHKDVDVFSEYFNLPKYVHPIVGLCVGYPTDLPKIKPRMPLKAILHEEDYNPDIMEDIIHDYDESFAKYLTSINRADYEVNWSQNTSKYYETNYSPAETSTLKKQGFTLED